MKKRFLLPFALLAFGYSNGQTTTTATLDFSKTHTISPYIFGYNQDHQNLSDDENWTIRRLGGNRMTVFNWENGASNSGHDNLQYPNDNRIPSLVGVPWNDKDNVGEAYRYFHQSNLDGNIESIITVPILGSVAADKNGSNLTSPPSNRWNDIVFKKSTPFSLTPNLTDGKVYVDESVNFLVQKFGDAKSSTGIKYISLDNEPALWDATHDLLQPSAPSATVYVGKIIEAAKAIKAVDPNVKIIAGEFAGINLYDFGGAPDWSIVKNGYDWFPSYFLDTLKKASDEVGFPLIDIISFHNYPQHKIDNNGNFSGSGITVKGSSSTADHIRKARMDFPRSLWDENYIEPSWLTNSKLKGAANKILVRMQQSIDTYFPSVKIMIGEYDYGHDTDISHGLAIADFLGVVTQKNVEIVTRWDLASNSSNLDPYTSSAYQLFRNYDGQKSTFGNVSIQSTFDNIDNSSVWASTDTDDEDLHLILINKDLKNNTNFVINLTDKDFQHSFKELYHFDNTSTAISTGKSSDVTISDAQVNCSIPPLTAYHLVIKREKIITQSLDKSQGSLKVFPNLFQDQVTVQFSQKESGKIQVISLEGQIIQTYDFNDTSQKTLNTQAINKGEYILKIKTKQSSYQKLIVKS